MTELINWLLVIERRAKDLYTSAAQHFGDNEPLSRFLADLAKDEEWHLELITAADDIVRSSGARFDSAIMLDSSRQSLVDDQMNLVTREVPSDTREANLTAQFDLVAAQIDAGTITVAGMLEHIVTVEFSEWNNIFLYVIQLLKSENRTFQLAASRIQAHKKKIEEYIQTSPEGARFIDHIKRLPPVWTLKILIVDDEPAIAGFLKMLFEDQAEVHIARNGQEALTLVNNQFFDVILTDVKMPVMDGVEFYRKASELVPDIGRRFLFFSGSSESPSRSFFRDNNLAYLPKPASIKNIEQKVQEILKRSSGT